MGMLKNHTVYIFLYTGDNYINLLLVLPKITRLMSVTIMWLKKGIYIILL